MIIGGATAGSAVAWFLSANPDFDGSVLVVERDPSWSRSATIASNNCMRQQFATEINVTIAQYAAEFVRNFRENLGGSPDIPDIPIRNFGYLYLADNEDFADILRRDQALQAACGAGTRMLTGEQIASAYPFYHLDDIVAGSLNTVDEGAFDALTMVDWLGRKAVDNGVDYIHNEVVAIKRVADRIETILLRSGETITAGIVSMRRHPGRPLARMAGLDLPIEARRRDTFTFSVDSPLDQDLPLTIDPTGVHMRSYGAHDYLVGCPPIGEDTAIDVDDFDHPQNTWERSARRVTG